MTRWARIGLVAICASCASAADRGDAGDAGDDGGGDAGFIVDAGPTYSVRGQVAHVDGTPWSNATVGFCSSIACLNPIHASAAGTFDEAELSPDAYVVDVTGDNSDGGSASPVYFHFQVESDLTLSSPVVLPETGPGVSVDGGVQTVQLDSALSVTVDPSAVTWPEGAGTGLACIRLKEGDWPGSYVSDLMDGGNDTILAVWALNPFQAASSTPIPVAIRNEFELSPGSRAKLFGINVASGMPADAVDVEVVSDGGFLTTLPGQGLTQLTWLLLVTGS